MKVEHELKLDRTEMSMHRWMCVFTLKERKRSSMSRELLGLELMRNRGRLRWFGHVKCKHVVRWIKRCVMIRTDGKA